MLYKTPENRLVANRKWLADHREEVNARRNEKRRLNPHKARSDARAYRLRRLKENPDDFRSKQRAVGQRTNNKLRRETFEHYGGRCACCGEAEKVFLVIDHIDGNGGKERKLLPAWCRRGVNFYRLLRRRGFPKGYRVLCHNCNQAVAIGKCPHQL